jgi:hypothetical protein
MERMIALQEQALQQGGGAARRVPLGMEQHVEDISTAAANEAALKHLRLTFVSGLPDPVNIGLLRLTPTGVLKAWARDMYRDDDKREMRASSLQRRPSRRTTRPRNLARGGESNKPD